jgi:hypothetical protein
MYFYRLLQLIFTFFFLTFNAFAQTQPSQTVRGKVVDSESNYPLIGAKVTIWTEDSIPNLRAITDVDGNFSIQKVPVGKHQLEVNLMTYESQAVTIEVNSGRETVLTIPLSEAYLEQEEVTVTARKQGEVINELAVISAQQFSVEESNRYPGSRMDPARMASNFAGVQGADDSRNDIVVRGNSPLGIIYRVEGIDIPNPSHFAIAGSTGGPVSILNNKILGNSDFFMSAFPAEYGNSISGVFDLKLRNGNDNQTEFTGQFGFLGTEFLAEGPMSKNSRSSFLVMGRYSTLSLFQRIGVQIGTDAVPVYGDGAFKFNWPLKSGGQLSFWGMGGKSDIDIMISEQTEYSSEFYGEGDRDQYFGTAMLTSGITYKKPISEKTFLQSTIAFSFESQQSRHNYLERSLNISATGDTSIQVDSIYSLMGYDFRIGKLSGYTAINHKFNKKHLIKAGINFDLLSMSQLDSALVDIDVPDVFALRWDYSGKAALVQPFVQWKWRMSEKMDFTAGLHAQYFSLSNSISPLEPRIGWKYRLLGNQSVFAGAGMHSQTQPYYMYTYHRYDADGNKVLHNKNMDFTRSIHSGIGYEKFFNKSFSVRTEAYYQSLYNIPVTVLPSSFSMINVGSGFARFFPDTLQNTGTGYNYGLELTVQKYFDKSFFFLFSGTLYDSRYKGSDGILRNTSYNGAYVANVLAGKEFKIGVKHVLGFGLKVTRAGGKRYGLVDVEETEELKEMVFLDSLFNEPQFADYFRVDLKVSWRLNTEKMTHEIGLDLVNVLNTENVLSLVYAPSLDPNVVNNPNYQPFRQNNQLGFLPIFYYKADFKLKRKE